MPANTVEDWEGRAVHPDRKPRPVDVSELGGSSNTIYGNFILDEYNPDLRGPNGIKTYDKMRRGDAQVRGTLRLLKTPITAAEWWVEPASNEQNDVDAADFVQWNLTRAMHHPWGRFLWEALSFLDFGYYLFEKVFEYGFWAPNRKGAHSKEVVYLSKLAPRHPMSIAGWEYDKHGEPTAALQQSWRLEGLHEIKIPYNKLLVLSLDEESDNPEGMSILRSAYKHWYFKDNLYKVDAIQKERHGIGIPDIALPQGYSPEDKAKAEELGQNLRTNEKAYVVRPPGWEIGFIELRGQPVDVLKSAEHHDLMIARNVLAQFMNLGSTTSGSRALGGSQMEIFMKALRYISGIIAQQFNTFVIPQLVDYNFNTVARYPQLRVRRIGENADWRSLSVAIRNLVESQVLTATPEFEQWLAGQMDFPMPSQAALDRPLEDRLKVKPGGTATPTPAGPAGPSNEAGADNLGTRTPKQNKKPTN